MSKYYDKQVECLDFLKNADVSDFSKQTNYLDYLIINFNKIYKEHEDELAGDKELQKAKIIIDNLNDKIYKSNSGEKSTKSKFDDVVSSARNGTIYAMHSVQESYNSVFRDYYDTVAAMEKYSKEADTALGEVEKQIAEVEKSGKSWGDMIETVEDESVKSQMMSDQMTSTQSINKEDVAKLRLIVQKMHTQVDNLKKDIESVKFLGKQLCKEYNMHWYGIYEAYIEDNNAFPELIVDFTDIPPKSNEDAMKRESFKPGDLFPQYSTLSANIQKVKFFDGKNDIDGTDDPNEQFYNVLYNSYGNKPHGVGAKSEEQNAINNINDLSTVDKNGNSKGTPKEDPDNPKAKISGSGNPKSTNSKKPGTGGKAEEVTKAYKAIKKQDNTSEEKLKYGSAQGAKVSSGKKSDKDYQADAGKGKSSLSEAAKLLQKIADIGKTLGQDLYLEEYFTEMFTCQTDKKGKVGEEGGLKLINGYSNIPEVKGHYKPINQNNAWYGKEIEFILWGDDDLDSNLTKNEAMIFLIRFAINVIYAFTAADIQSFANSIATAIVGWTVVLVPVVSAIITIGIAMAESAYDLHLLKEGKDVVIIKDVSTFVCSPTGLLKTVATEMTEEALKYAEKRIEDAIDSEIDKLVKDGKKWISECKDEVNKICNKYAEQLAESVYTGIRDQFVTPMINSVTPMINQMNSTLSNADDLVEEKIDAAWEVIKSNIGSMDNGTIKEMAQKFLDENGESLKKTIKEEIKKKLNSEKIKKVADISPKEIQDFINEKVKKAIDGFKNTITRKVKEMTDKMEKEIMSHADEAIGNLKNYIHEGISNTAKQVTQQITSTISQNLTDGIDKAASGGLTLNYKEYCKIFMFIKLAAGGEQNCLLRAAALIQANVRYAVEDKENNLPGGNKSFDITQSYTIMYIGAKARVKTIFPWGLTVNDNDPTNTGNAEFDLYNMGDNSIVINYSGINSY